MTRIVKSAEAKKLVVRAMSSAWRVEPLRPPEDPELGRLRKQATDLEAELARMRQEALVLQRDAERAFREGEAIGRKLGEAETRDTHERALTRLGSGVDQALAQLSQELQGLERLAPLLAREALTLILEADAERSRVMTSLIRRQLARLKDQAVLIIEVSRADLPDAAALSATLGRPGVEVRTLDELASGECRFRLTLGSVELGLHQQWGRLSTLLEHMAQPERGE
ncbi:MAG TPA: hypothetical protein VG407_07185 [Caulobacteraceae bacterium]|nr:hypothetical protein [Caulobacteraceae bacterium]